MNNEISREINPYLNQALQKSQSGINMPENKVEVSQSKENLMNETLDFLGTMGQAQIYYNQSLTSDGVKKSVEKFLADPEGCEEYNYLCDEIVKKGNGLEKSIEVCDKIFKTLKNNQIYKQ